MESSSSSQSANPPEKRFMQLADIFGAAIALLTLVLPLVSIAYYSTQSRDILRPPTMPALLNDGMN